MAQLDRGIHDPYAAMRQVPSFELTSSEFREGGALPLSVYDLSVGGQTRSPQLAWHGAPAETRSYVVTCFDPDAPTGSGFWHWAVANIPAEVASLEAGAGDPAAGLLPVGAITMPNELRASAFTGAAPPEGTGVHHYWFVVHALNVERIEVDPQATPAVLGFLMRDAVIARAVLVATGEFGAAE